MVKKVTFLSWAFCKYWGLRKEQEEDEQRDNKKIIRKHQRHGRYVFKSISQLSGQLFSSQLIDT